MAYEYDVCLSYAGEQRDYVEQVAEALRADGSAKIFYDRYEAAGLWGKNLVDHLDWVYRKSSRFCVLFASADYAAKVWTDHERRSAQARALTSRSEYILPVRFDETEIPGLLPTVEHIDARRTSPTELAALIVHKSRSAPAPGGE